jgi:glycosyltransferase involved in cell wall biosynthesis
VAKLGYETSLVCGWKVREGEVKDGVTFHPFAPSQSRLRRIYQLPLRIFRTLRPLLRRTDIVHFHDIDLLPWMALLAVVLRKHVVYDCHENYAEGMLTKLWLPRPLRRPLYHLVRWGQPFFARFMHNVVIVTQAQKSDFCTSGLNVVEIRNYASLDLLQHVTSDYASRAPAVIFTGSQYPENGSLLLLEIASRTRRRLPGIVFYAPDRFWATGFREQYLAERKARGLEDTVILFANLPPHELMEALNRATTAILPNLRVPTQVRAIPTKFFEYMAAGLPIVASDLPVAVEIVAGSDAGLLARPEDPDSFVEAIAQLVEDRALALRMAANAQKAFRDRYSWESQSPVYERYYERILGHRILESAAYAGAGQG